MKVEALSSLLLASSVLALRNAKDEPMVKDLKAFKTNAHKVLTDIHRSREYDSTEKGEYFANVFERLVLAGGSTRARSQTAVSEFFKCLSNDDIEKYGRYMVRAFGTWMDVVKNESKARKVITASRESILAAVEMYIARTDKRDLRAINPEWLKEGGSRLIRVLQKRDKKSGGRKPALAEVPATFWSWIAGRPASEQEEFCSVIDYRVFEQLSKESASKISAHCFASIKNVGSADISQLIPKLNDTVFKYFTGRVVAKNVKAMKPAQLASFNIESPAERRGARIDLHGATKEGIKSVTGACLASYLIGNRNSALGALWGSISKDIFDSLNSNSSYEFDFAEIARAINQADKVHIPAETLNRFLSFPGFAENLVAEGDLKRNGVFKISPKELPQLKDKKIFVAALISNETLDPMFLAHLDADFFSGLEYTHQGKTFEELRVLDLIKASNKAELVKNLSSSIEGGQHACSLIKTVDQFKAVKSLEFASPDCISELTFDMELDDYKKMPALLRGRSFKKVAKHLTDDELARMTEPFFAALLTGDVCEVITYKKFSKINPDVLSAVNSDCIGKFNDEFVSNLTVEQTTRFSDAAFEFFNVARWKATSFSFKNLNDKQLANLSISVKNDSEMVASTFTEKEISDLGRRVTQLSARQVSVLPEKTLVAIPIANLSASSLTMLNAAKVKALIPVFANMTAAQIEKLGASSNDLPAVTKLIDENKSKLDKEAHEAWEKRRISANSAKILTRGTVTALALGLVAVILL